MADRPPKRLYVRDGPDGVPVVLDPAAFDEALRQMLGTHAVNRKQARAVRKRLRQMLRAARRGDVLGVG